MGLTDGMGDFFSTGDPPPPKFDPADALRPLDGPTWGRMEQAYYHGLQKGETTHIKPLDEHYKWMPGYLYIWTGWMNEGKTEFILQLLLLRAVLSGKKSALYSPENMPEEQLYDQLIHALTGQNPDRDWQVRLSLPRYQQARDFVKEHFVVVYPRRGMGRTPQHLLSYFEAAIARYGVSHCLLDPWNKADHSALASLGGPEPYLMNTLDAIGMWAQDTKQSFLIAAHPRQLPDMKHGQARPIPDSSHVAGGQQWENQAHVATTYYRPWKHLGSKDPLYSEVALYIKKVKSRKLVGVPGELGDGTLNDAVRIRYDWQTARYYFNGVSPLDCRAAEECYLTDAELREADDRRPARAAQPVPASPHADHQPATLRTKGPSAFDFEGPARGEEFPTNWHPNGRTL